MRLFFIKLSLMILAIAAAVAIEWWRTEQKIEAVGYPHAEYELIVGAMKLVRQEPNLKVVIAGDSKAQRHVDPNLFHEAGYPSINISLPSTDLWTMVEVMEFIGLNKLRAVFLISVGAYHINDGNDDRGSSTSEVYFHLTPLERLKIYKSSYFQSARHMLEVAKKGASPDQFVSMAALPFNIANRGFLPMEGDAGLVCIPFRHNSRVSPVAIYRNINPDGARWRLFQEAVKRLSKWPSPVILFNSPYSERGMKCLEGTYAGNFEKEFSRRMVELVRPYQNLRFLDFYWDHSQIRIPDEHFFDPGHLNKEGAAEFTRWWLGYLKRESLL